MAFHASSYIKTTTVAVQRVRDQLVFPFTARPQAMTAYIRFVVGYPGIAATDRALIQVGNNATTAPRWYVAVSGNGTAAALQGQYLNGNSTVTCTISSLTFTTGVTWEVRVTLTAAGVFQIHYSIAGTAEVSGTATSALVLPTAWASQHLMVNSAGTVGVNLAAYRNIWVGRGIHDLDACRRFAGT